MAVAVAFPVEKVISFVIIFEVIGYFIWVAVARVRTGVASGRVLIWVGDEEILCEGGAVGGHGAAYVHITGDSADVGERIARGSSPNNELLGRISAAHTAPFITVCPG